MVVLQIAAHVAAGLLLVAGIGKLAQPDATREALRLRAPGATLRVRALGGAEILLAAAVLLVGGPVPFALLAGSYLAFTAVAWRQGRAGRGCGCLGGPSTPVGWPHLAADLVATGAAAAAAVTATPGLVGVLPAGPLAAGATLVLVVVAVGLARSVLTDLSAVLAARRTLLGGVAT